MTARVIHAPGVNFVFLEDKTASRKHNRRQLHKKINLIMIQALAVFISIAGALTLRPYTMGAGLLLLMYICYYREGKKI